MHQNLATWQFIQHSIHVQIPVMLLYVLQSNGSSPGRQGFMMAVNKDGILQGSLGGGIMEYKFVTLAKERLQQPKITASVHLQIHDKAAPSHQSGMICSGEQTIFIYQVLPSDISTINAIVQSLLLNKNGTLQLSNTGIVFTNDVPDCNFLFTTTKATFQFIQKTGYHQTLCIIGAGHCALALAKLMSEMDFYIKIFDERHDLNTMVQNTFVHQKCILDSYANLNTVLQSDVNTYIVVMTFGYRTDDIAVRALMHQPFAYFGLLGSKAKIHKMFETYKSEGIATTLLKTIHAPIGIPIKSQTPQEIAISIAAEIIKVKNQALT